MCLSLSPLMVSYKPQAGQKKIPKGATQGSNTPSHLFRYLKYPRVCGSALPRAPKARHSLAPTVRSGKAKSMLQLFCAEITAVPMISGLDHIVDTRLNI